MKNLYGAIYKGKKVLITGHTGFKGSWLSLWLSKLGAEVIGYSINIPSSPNHFELLDIKMKSVSGDVLDKQKLLETIATHKPDIVFHMAAQPIVRLSYQEPVRTLETNIIGTLNVLESCRQIKGVKAIVIITSDKCYRNQEIMWGYRETDPMGGDDPYSASKGCADLIASSYRQSFFNPNSYGTKHKTLIGTVRAGNVIGGGDWAKDRLIPDIMKATNLGKEVTIRNPYATRPWQHVLEPLSGYLHLGWKLLEGKKEFSDSWNFGPNDNSSIAVGKVIEKVKSYWKNVRYEIQKDAANPHEANLLKLDSTKAHTKLGWYAVWNSEKTFEKTTIWYKKYYTSKKLLTRKDLTDYIREAKNLKIEWATT
ncbi:MAG: CDP-glucose 4,6-dehydratase [Candidatus Vogelbacteria bacterium]|nr:CDP-glucose 4,6-dehydratase [Candidatus Vogelbacteria bacterium]